MESMNIMINEQEKRISEKRKRRIGSKTVIGQPTSRTLRGEVHSRPYYFYIQAIFFWGGLFLYCHCSRSDYS